MTFDTNVRFTANIEIGIDPDKSKKWIAKTVNDARNILNVGMRDGPQTGRQYPRGARVHIASASGQWPAIDTGNLRINTRMRVTPFEGELGSNVDYAEYLQFGTRKMKPRKLYIEALDMAIEDNIDELGDILFIRSENDSE